MKNNSIFTKWGKSKQLNSILYNRVLLYVILIISLINMTVYSLLGDITTPLIFILLGVIISYFNKNMLIILFISLIFSNIIKYGSKITINEGFSEDKETNDDNDESMDEREINDENNKEINKKEVNKKETNKNTKSKNEKMTTQSKNVNMKSNKKSSKDEKINTDKKQSKDENKTPPINKETQESFQDFYSLQKQIEESMNSLTNDLNNAEQIIEKLQSKYLK